MFSGVLFKWTISSFGSPSASVQLVCVAPGEPCTAATTFYSTTTTSTGASDQQNHFSGFTANNSQYDCFVVATNIVAKKCSAPVSITVSLAPAPYYNFTLLNGTQLAYMPSSNILCFGCADSIPITVARLSCPFPTVNVGPSYGSCGTNQSLVMANIDSSQFVWMSGANLRLNDYYDNTWTLYSYPGGGGYALRTQHGSQWIFYNPSTSELWYEVNVPAGSGSYLAVFNVDPPPPSDWITGTLRAASAPSTPANGTVTVNTWTSNWTTGADTGFPEAVYRLRCVPSGSDCLTGSPRYDGSEVSASTTSQTLSGLVVGNIYSCFGGFIRR